MKHWSEPSSGGAMSVSASLSVLVHAVLIGASIAITAAPKVARPEPELNIVRFLAPPDRAGRSVEQVEQVKFVALTDPVVEASAPEREPVPKPSEPPPDRPTGFDLQDAPATPQLAGQDSVFTQLEVDSAATRYAWSAAPVYPPAMLEAKREGFVMARWVVDEEGFADTSTFRLLDYTSDEFAKAVRDALPFMRFSPAKRNGRAVPQLVEQQFAFRLNMAVVAEPKKPET